MLGLGEVGDVEDVGEGREHLHLLQDLPPRRGADDEQPLPLRRVLLQQHQDRLQRQVGISGSDGAVVQEPLDVVHEDAGHGGAVGVVKDAADLHALGRLREAHHVLGAGKFVAIIITSLSKKHSIVR